MVPCAGVALHKIVSAELETQTGGDTNHASIPPQNPGGGLFPQGAVKRQPQTNSAALVPTFGTSVKFVSLGFVSDPVSGPSSCLELREKLLDVEPGLLVILVAAFDPSDFADQDAPEDMPWVLRRPVEVEVFRLLFFPNRSLLLRVLMVHQRGIRTHTKREAASTDSRPGIAVDIFFYSIDLP